MSGIIAVGGGSSGSSGGGNTFTSETLFLGPAPFQTVDLLSQFSGGFAVTRFDTNGTTLVSYTAAPIVGANALTVSADGTEFWATVGSGTTGNLYKMNRNTLVTTVVPLSGGAADAIITLAVDPITGTLYTKGSSSASPIYSLNPTTGVMTLIASVSPAPNNNNWGFVFTGDGRMFINALYTGVGGTEGVIREIVRPEQAMAMAVPAFGQVKQISVGMVGRGVIGATQRNSFIVTGGVATAEEVDYAGNILKGSAGYSLGSGASLAVIPPIGGRRDLFLNAPIQKVTELDSLGVVQNVFFFAANGDDVTSLIEPNWLLPHRSDPDPIPSDNQTPLRTVSGSIAFGSIVTASYATLITFPTPTQFSRFQQGAVLKVNNKLDVPVSLGFSASTTVTNPIFIDVGETFVLDLSANDLNIITTARVQAVGSNASSGNIYGSLIY